MSRGSFRICIYPTGMFLHLAQEGLRIIRDCHDSQEGAHSAMSIDNEHSALKGLVLTFYGPEVLVQRTMRRAEKIYKLTHGWRELEKLVADDIFTDGP